MNYVEPIRDKEVVKDIGLYLKSINEKWYVMYLIGIYSGLRISDILDLRVRDVKNKREIRVRENKSGKERLFPVNAELARTINEYTKDKKPWEFLIASTYKSGHVCREYAYRVIRKAGEHFGLEHLGTHTMRKTFGYHFYMQTKDIVLLMKILNHSDEKITLRYIGIEQTTINEAMRHFKY